MPDPQPSPGGKPKKGCSNRKRISLRIGLRASKKGKRKSTKGRCTFGVRQKGRRIESSIGCRD